MEERGEEEGKGGDGWGTLVALGLLALVVLASTLLLLFTAVVVVMVVGVEDCVWRGEWGGEEEGEG